MSGYRDPRFKNRLNEADEQLLKPCKCGSLICESYEVEQERGCNCIDDCDGCKQSAGNDQSLPRTGKDLFTQWCPACGARGDQPHQDDCEIVFGQQDDPECIDHSIWPDRTAFSIRSLTNGGWLIVDQMNCDYPKEYYVSSIKELHLWIDQRVGG